MFIAHDESYLKRYKEQDEHGRFFWDTLARPGLRNPIIYDIEAPDGSIISNGWIISKNRFEKEYAEGKIRIIENNNKWSVQFKQYLNLNGKKPEV
jgi:adenine-specific DNA-methyltransferase